MRSQQDKLLVEYLREKGGKATIREIRQECYIQNPGDAKMRAIKKGFDIRTEKLHDNPKIASYVLYEEPKSLFSFHKHGECGGVCKDCAPKGMDKTYGVGKTQSLLPIEEPNKSRAYE